MTTTSNGNNSGSGLVPIDPHHHLDPYPERQTSLGGVRQHNPPTPAQDRMVEISPTVSGPLLFRDNPPPVHVAPGRRRLMPWVSTGLYALGQVALAVAIATDDIEPLPGIAVCLIWLLCGLLLIGAQTMSQARTIDDDRRSLR